MHWLTVIFGFLAAYCLAGLTYTLTLGAGHETTDALWIWGLGLIIFALASGLNQALRSRPRAKIEPEDGPKEHS